MSSTPLSTLEPPQAFQRLGSWFDSGDLSDLDVDVVTQSSSSSLLIKTLKCHRVVLHHTCPVLSRQFSSGSLSRVTLEVESESSVPYAEAVIYFCYDGRLPSRVLSSTQDLIRVYQTAQQMEVPSCSLACLKRACARLDSDRDRDAVAFIMTCGRGSIIPPPLRQDAMEKCWRRILDDITSSSSWAALEDRVRAWYVRLLLYRYGHLPLTMATPRLLTEFVALPFEAHMAFFSSNELTVESENDVGALVTLIRFYREKVDYPLDKTERLLHSMRLAHLTPYYLCRVARMLYSTAAPEQHWIMDAIMVRCGSRRTCAKSVHDAWKPSAPPRSGKPSALPPAPWAPAPVHANDAEENESEINHDFGQDFVIEITSKLSIMERAIDNTDINVAQRRRLSWNSFSCRGAIAHGLWWTLSVYLDILEGGDACLSLGLYHLIAPQEMFTAQNMMVGGAPCLDICCTFYCGSGDKTLLREQQDIRMAHGVTCISTSIANFPMQRPSNLSQCVRSAHGLPAVADEITFSVRVRVRD